MACNDFELIIINDGSTDSTKKIIESYHDSRLSMVENEKKLGITKSLNSGIKLAKGKYVARMDADDISLSTRFEKQVLSLEKNRQIDVSGALTKIIGGKSNTIWKYPVDSDRIKASLLFHC